MNVFEFGKIFKDEATIHQYALDMGFIMPPTLICPVCGSKCYVDKTKIRRGFASCTRCNNKQCRKRFSAQY